jgi:D-alanine-D-alanine ligase
VRKLKVAVLAGGWSAERPISLSSGFEVWKAFRGLGWDAIGMDLVQDPPRRGSGQGSSRVQSPVWARRVPLADLLPRLQGSGIQAVFLCLHGPGGEDGCIQGLLELAGIPYTGSGVQASSLAMDKGLSKKIFRQSGLPTPDWTLVPRGGRASFRKPVAVKPPSQGSSVGVTLVRRAGQMAKALKLAWGHEPVALVEDLVEGRELTAGILGDRALPVIEIKPQHEFYDWHSKYEPGGSEHLCPAPISRSLTPRVQALALQAHRALGCRAYSRVDLMLDRNERPWVIEVNTLPGMTPTSLLPDSAKVAGLSYGKLLVEMLEHSLKK